MPELTWMGSGTVLRRHVAAFDAIGGAARKITYDGRKTGAIGKSAEALIVYNRSIVDLARRYGCQPRAYWPYRPKTEGKVERPIRYIREDFSLDSAFRDLDDLNARVPLSLDTVGNPCPHTTTGRVGDGASIGEKASFQAHGGMISVRGNVYSVPDTTRRRVFDVHVLAYEVRIFEDPVLVASHALLKGRGQKRLDPAHRRAISFPRSRAAQ